MARSDLIAEVVVQDVTNVSEPGGPIPRTIVTARVLDQIHSSPTCVQKDRSTVRLIIPGGSQGGRTVRISDSPCPAVGDSLLIFARDDGLVYLSPFVGGEQGLYRISGPQTESIRTYGGHALDLQPSTQGTQIIPLAPSESGAGGPRQAPPPQAHDPSDQVGDFMSLHANPVTSSSFIASIREAVSRPGHSAPILRSDRAGRGYHRNADGTVVVVPLPVGQVQMGRRGQRDASIPLAPLPAQLQNPTDPCVGGYQDLPLRMEMVPSGWWSYPALSNALADWDRYMQVFTPTTSDGFYGDGNGQNEFCGWVSDYDLNRVYGYHWGDAIGMTLSRSDGRHIVEADIAFNAADDWTDDVATAWDNPTIILLSSCAMHELGHVWGYWSGVCPPETYEYYVLSVMHMYHGGLYDDGRGISATDAWLFRDDYRGRTSVKSVHDVAVKGFHAHGHLVQGGCDQGQYRPGDPITMSGFTVENTGTSEESDVRLRFYLSTDRTISTTDTQIGSYLTFGRFCSECSSYPTFTSALPTALNRGQYYVGIIVTRGGFGSDDFAPNNTTVFNTPLEITCPQTPETPLPHSPDDGATCVSVTPTMDWDDVAQAAGYRLQIDGDPGFSSPEVNAETVGSTYQVPAGRLNRSTRYYWRTGARNSCNEWGSWSGSGRSFTTSPDALGAPVAAAPSDGASCISAAPLLQWNGLPGAARYEVQVALDITYGSPVLDEETSGSSDAVLEGRLMPATRYFWRIRAVDGCNRWGTWSNGGRSFSTAPGAPAAPSLVAPADNASCVPAIVNLEWDEAPSATAYRIQIDKGSDFTDPEVDEWTTSSSYQTSPGALSWSTRYYWRASAKSSCDEWGPWSGSERSFVTAPDSIDAPSPAAPDDGASCVSVALTLRWGEVTGAARYQVQVDRNATYESPVLDEETPDRAMSFPTGASRSLRGTSGGSGPWTAATGGERGLRVAGVLQRRRQRPRRRR